MESKFTGCAMLGSLFDIRSCPSGFQLTTFCKHCFVHHEFDGDGP